MARQRLKIHIMKALYNKAKSAKTGDTIKCPHCAKEHEKTTYHKVFCSNYKTRGRNNCKDNFWNTVDPEKACRNTPYFHDVILPDIAKKRGFPDIDTMQNHPLDDDGSWDAHQCETGKCDFCGLKHDYCRCGEGADGV